ncbi:MAG: hypothetical protein [Caudoviricetes sp.]|nr:MAG: hypothetical protein [Caudoviricetes sp.]
MANNIIYDKVLDFDMLKLYDTNVKAWAIDKIDKSQNIFFKKREEFPIIGNTNALYIDEDKIYVWSQKISDYKLITGGSSGGTTVIETVEWEYFN